jgi:hypothetical protein
MGGALISAGHRQKLPFRAKWRIQNLPFRAKTAIQNLPFRAKYAI